MFQIHLKEMRPRWAWNWR